MRMPQPPTNDDVSSRHSYYGAVSATLGSLSDRVDKNKEELLRHDESFTDRLHSIRSSIEDTNIRINKRTYKDDFDSLSTRVGKTEEFSLANKTAWGTARSIMAIVGVILLSLGGWATTTVQNSMEDYSKRMEKLENRSDSLQESIKESRTMIFSLKNKDSSGEPEL